MKIIILFGAIAFATAKPFPYFTTANDYLDLDNILKDPAIVKYFMDCFLDRTVCDAFNDSYKKNAFEAVYTACYRCNDAQKRLWNDFTRILNDDYPGEFKAFQKKYDPYNLYSARFLEAVKYY